MRVHGTSGGSGRRRERRFGGSSSLFRPTTGTPTGCELFACDDAALIHGVKVEPMLKLEFELLVQSNPRRIHAHLSQIRGFSRRILQTPPPKLDLTKPRASDFFLRSRAFQVSSYSAMSPETRDAGSRDNTGDGRVAGTGGIFTFARSRCAQFSPRRRGRVRGGAVLAVLLSARDANAVSVSVGDSMKW